MGVPELAAELTTSTPDVTIADSAADEETTLSGVDTEARAEEEPKAGDAETTSGAGVSTGATEMTVMISTTEDDTSEGIAELETAESLARGLIDASGVEVTTSEIMDEL